MQLAINVGIERLAFLIRQGGPGVSASNSDGPDLPIITSDEDLDKFLWDYFQIKLPNQVCCQAHTDKDGQHHPAHSTPWQAFHDAYFARYPVTVWKASRGFGGKSFLMSLLAMTEALTLRADVNILGGSGTQSKRVLETIGKLWAVPTAPRDALRSEPGGQKQTLAWGNQIVALMASQASVRGPHPQRLRMDEVDEMKLTILDSALGQPMNKGWVLSQVVLSSTHQYPDGTMTAILKRAKINGWPVYEWCYKENLEPHGWLTQAEVERKRAILTVDMWNTEIELQEPSSEGRAIDTKAVEKAFSHELKLEDPVKEAKYSHGADWAKKVNYTVVVSIRKDVRPMRVVAVKRVQKEPWPKMAAILDTQVGSYGGTSVHDNTGIGQVVHDLLTHDSEPFDMVGRDRADLLTEYVAAVEKGDLQWPRDDSHPALAAAYGEHKYAKREDLYKGSKDGTGTHHLPDTISAAALAWRAASKAPASSSTKPPEQTAAIERLGAAAQRLRARRDSQAPRAEEPAAQVEPVIVTRTGWKRKGKP